MRTIHAILAIRQRLYRDLLGAVLSRDYDVRVIAQTDFEAVATSLRILLDDGEFPIDDPVIVIMSIDESGDIPASCSHLLCEFPEVTIIGICWANATVRSFQLRIDVQEIPCSMQSLVDAMRECNSRSLPW
ncbi:MAG TPA: hypothetical protein VGM98_25580 [Schlesneria sp.]